MAPLRALTGLVFATLLAGGLAACSAAPDSGAATGDEEDVKEKKTLYGDDRVGNMLRDHPELIPGSFQAYEKLFKVGRECARTDSKEIFVVEESSSRADGTQTHLDALLPRAVVTGCNTGDHSNPDSIKASFELFAALISSPRAEHAAGGDPMLFTPLEVMALDNTTGTYNFYVFKSNGEGKPGTIIRVMRNPGTSDIVKFEHTMGGKPKPSQAQTNACFSCHVNGGPIMNEMSRPWTNWVSVLKTLPKEKLTGETLSVVSEAAPIGDSQRSSFANELEQTMRAAIRLWVNGSTPTTGFGQMTLEGSTPGGIPLLLKSTFCETELNYASSSDTVPMELFVDADLAAGSGLQPPAAIAGQVFPFQLPMRAEHDKRVEKFMMKRGFITPRTALAVRLVDEGHDVFSKTRCDLHAELVKTTFTKDKPADVDAAIRALLAAKLKAKAFKLNAAQSDYMAALIDVTRDDGTIAPLRAAYFADLTTRYTKAIDALEDTKGLADLKASVDTRKKGARALFSAPANPLPVLDN
jgi:hypothetical protein